MVYGGPLPPRYHHTPYCSFTAGDATPTLESVDAGVGVSAPPPAYPEVAIRGAVEELVEREVVGTCRETAQECVKEVNT